MERDGKDSFSQGEKVAYYSLDIANVLSDFRMLLWLDNDIAALKMLMVMETVAM